MGYGNETGAVRRCKDCRQPFTLPGSGRYTWTTAPSSLAHAHKGLLQMMPITHDQGHSKMSSWVRQALVAFSMSTISTPLLSRRIFWFFTFRAFLASWILPHLWQTVYWSPDPVSIRRFWVCLSILCLCLTMFDLTTLLSQKMTKKIARKERFYKWTRLVEERIQRRNKLIRGARTATVT